MRPEERLAALLHSMYCAPMGFGPDECVGSTDDNGCIDRARRLVAAEVSVPAEPGPRPSVTWKGADRTAIVLMAPIVDGLCSGCGTKPTRETGSCRCLFRVDDVIRGDVALASAEADTRRHIERIIELEAASGVPTKPGAPDPVIAEYEALLQEHNALREAAQDVVTRWFDWIDGEASQTLRAAMIRLREALAASRPVPAPEPSALPKILVGMLERLPRERVWSDDEFDEWMTMFEGAIRVHYRTPRRAATPQDPEA